MLDQLDWTIKMIFFNPWKIDIKKLSLKAEFFQPNLLNLNAARSCT